MPLVPRATAPRVLTGAAICVVAALLVVQFTGGDAAATRQPSSSFSAHVAALSEPGGYFDTDNLISNERSYLQVLSGLRSAGIRGGAYVGVGPDTNFSYIAEVRPTIAFIVDIRRNNLLLHLLFKALFAISPTRTEYLGSLIGRAPPEGSGWRGAGIDKIVAHFDAAPRGTAGLPALRRRIADTIHGTGVSLSPDDFATISAFHQRFMDEGLALRFNSAGRAPQPHYPTYRDLLLESDASGRQASYLASDEAFQFVKSMQARDLIVPVVGDFGGPKALASIGRELNRRGERLSAFYASNVEFYLFGQGTYSNFLENLRQIPHTRTSVLIRSVFGRYIAGARPGDGSTSQLQPIEDLLTGAAQGRFRSYGQLVMR